MRRVKLKKQYWVLLGVAILALSLGSGYYFFSKKAGQDEHGHGEEGHDDHDDEGGALTDGLVKKLDIPIAKAKGGEIDNYILLFGKVGLHPEKSLHLHPKYSGVVRDVYKSVGETVKTGDVLARVESNFGVQTYNLTSTINGTILERRIAAGQSVNEDLEAFTIADMAHVQITLVAYARDLGKLKAGDKLILSGSGNNVPTTIFYISPLLDSKTGTANVLVNLTNEGTLWRPGQFVIGRIPSGKKPVAAKLPIALLDTQESKTATVYVRIGTEYVPRMVSLGSYDEEFAEVTSGLSPGEKYLNSKARDVEALTSEREHDEEEGHSVD